MHTIESFVINLKRRTDRIEKFEKVYSLYAPNIPYTRIEAIDANDFSDFEDIVNSENDFNNNLRVIACALSHMKTLETIIEKNCIGFIFEDDINFREDGLFKRNFDKIKMNIISAIQQLEDLENKNVIIYLGAGDVLPIHTNCINSQSLLRAQEKSHVKNSINEIIGYPKDKNAYMFDWIGAFAYCISPKTAKYILDKIKKEKLNKAIDVYLKENLTNLVVSPLLAYHDILEKCDSDIVVRTK